MPDYGDPDAILYPYLFSQSESNVLHVNDKYLDEMILKARSITDRKKRAEIYLDINKYIVSRNAYIIPLYFDRVKIVASKDLYVPPINGLGAWFVEFKHMRWNTL